MRQIRRRLATHNNVQIDDSDMLTGNFRSKTRKTGSTNLWGILKVTAIVIETHLFQPAVAKAKLQKRSNRAGAPHVKRQDW